MPYPMRARETFAWGQRVITAGEVVSSDDPVIARHASLFERIDIPAVEQATAAPGERRATRIPRKEG